MCKTNVSRCTIPKNKNNNNLYVKIKNMNENNSRKFNMNVYDSDSPTKELLPVYVDNQLTPTDTLEPREEKTYRIDVSNVGKRVVFEIAQIMGGTGIKVSRNKSETVNIHLK